MKSIHHKNLIIADSGYWVALGNNKDKFHRQAIKVFTQLTDVPITTWPVITEVCYLLERDCGFKPQQAFLQALENGSSRLFELRAGHLAKIQSLMQKYADLPMDLADASMVILAEELGHGRILSTDERDFKTYRWKNREPFENLLLTQS